MANWIDNLPSDKKSHIVLGNVINPIVIIISTILGRVFLPNVSIFRDFIIGGIGGVLICILIHIGIEYRQKYTGKGKFEWLDAFAGYSSALWLGVILVIINFLV